MKNYADNISGEFELHIINCKGMMHQNQNLDQVLTLQLLDKLLQELYLIGS